MNKKRDDFRIYKMNSMINKKNIDFLYIVLFLSSRSSSHKKMRYIPSKEPIKKVSVIATSRFICSTHARIIWGLETLQPSFINFQLIRATFTMPTNPTTVF